MIAQGGSTLGDSLLTFTVTDAVGATAEGTMFVTVTAVAPGPPSAVTAKAGPRSALVQCEAPAFSGGSPVLSYVALATPTEAAVASETGALASASWLTLWLLTDWFRLVRSAVPGGCGAPAGAVVAGGRPALPRQSAGQQRRRCGSVVRTQRALHADLAQYAFACCALGVLVLMP